MDSISNFQSNEITLFKLINDDLVGEAKLFRYYVQEINPDKLTPKYQTLAKIFWPKSLIINIF